MEASDEDMGVSKEERRNEMSDCDTQWLIKCCQLPIPMLDDERKAGDTPVDRITSLIKKDNTLQPITALIFTNDYYISFTTLLSIVVQVDTDHRKNVVVTMFDYMWAAAYIEIKSQDKAAITKENAQEKFADVALNGLAEALDQQVRDFYDGMAKKLDYPITDNRNILDLLLCLTLRTTLISGEESQVFFGYDLELFAKFPTLTKKQVVALNTFNEWNQDVPNLWDSIVEESKEKEEIQDVLQFDPKRPLCFAEILVPLAKYKQKVDKILKARKSEQPEKEDEKEEADDQTEDEEPKQAKSTKRKGEEPDAAPTPKQQKVTPSRRGKLPDLLKVIEIKGKTPNRILRLSVCKTNPRTEDFNESDLPGAYKNHPLLIEEFRLVKASPQTGKRASKSSQKAPRPQSQSQPKSQSSSSSVDSQPNSPSKSPILDDSVPRQLKSILLDDVMRKLGMSDTQFTQMAAAYENLEQVEKQHAKEMEEVQQRHKKQHKVASTKFREATLNALLKT